jgi:protein-disulfide isomerase
MGDRIKLVFKNYPLDTSCNRFMQTQVHPFACSSAVAAQCAARQGKFLLFHDLLFKNQYAQDPDSLMLYAMRVGLDIDEFKACLGDPSVLEQIKADIELGKRLGLPGVPALVIKDKIYLGARSADDLSSLLK